MINVDKLKARIVSKSFSNKSFAEAVGIAERTLYNVFKSGTTKTTTAEKMIELLEIENPVEYFFADFGMQ